MQQSLHHQEPGLHLPAYSPENVHTEFADPHPHHWQTCEQGQGCSDLKKNLKLEIISEIWKNLVYNQNSFIQF